MKALYLIITFLGAICLYLANDINLMVFCAVGTVISFVSYIDEKNKTR